MQVACFSFVVLRYICLFSLAIQEMLDFLLRVHAHEIFVDGYFNGDPHPGNILLLEDGRMGLIDYGQVIPHQKTKQPHHLTYLFA